MAINRNNYESFFLDYHEGVLDNTRRQEMLIFLDANPDLKAEFEAFEVIPVTAPRLVFEGKDKLKKEDITLLNYTGYFIAHVEGDLSGREEGDLRRFLEGNPALLPELEIFKKLRVLPDTEIVFKGKAGLKRNAKIIPFNSFVFRLAAAVFALLLVTYFFFQNKPTDHLADHQNSVNRHTEENGANSVPAIVSESANANTKESPVIAAGKNHTITVEKRKQETPLIAAKENTPAANTMQRMPTTGTVHPEIVLASHNDSPATLPIAQNKSAAPITMDSPSKLSDVFSSDDLEELGLSNTAPVKKDELWELAKKGVNGLGKMTGKEMALSKSDNDLENTQSVELAIGTFSFVRTVSK